ncbi:MAG: heparinase II/III family protein [Gemmatimonas sp.]|uniref:heparinase II/III domain-containing protein n=1 Tax=Gemmatimonas sp. TaxID=1962908 RepID=UPI00391F7604|nr:heparinase II/III-family protein [Gemmatimonadota bacterium]
MTQLLPLDLAARRAATASGTSLGALADALAAELAPLLERSLPIPTQKARLTRIGGRCPDHGLLLEFDPWAPHDHRCPRCDMVYRGREHDDWWAMGAQLWVVERAVHAAALFALRGDPAHSRLASRILRELAMRYPTWPNRDNVLGPTRPFFSTYLESIWLLNACHALALLESAGVSDVGGMVRDQLLAPSGTLIASYPEGRSNRQVWNEVAVLSALHLLGDTRACERRLEGNGSLPWLLAEGLLADGSWYEGENYHQFAHRGLWYGVYLLRALGRPLVPALDARFHAGFLTPFAGLLPDDTLPSRRDSPYAVSVRQWRYAEWCELGHAHRADRRLAGLLARLYDGTGGPPSDARRRSTADAERNVASSMLTRADCSWRALLMASPDPVPAGQWTPGSVVQAQQGLAVLRRESGRIYVALEGGIAGGGHGHPDRLALTLQADAERWLDDPGAGSYVERTLHWYRSTLAHHAPLVNGASQPPEPARLLAFEDRGGAGWVRKRVDELAPGVSATRTVVVCDGYLVDVLDWESEAEVTLTLPLAGPAVVHDIGTWRSGERDGAGGLEDGYDFVDDVEEAVLPPSSDVAVFTFDAIAHGGAGAPPPPSGRRMRAWYATHGASTLWRASTPGVPGTRSTLRHLLDQQGRRGCIVGVWSWSRAGAEDLEVARVHLTPQATPLVQITTRDGTVASHEPAPHGWHIGLLARHARSSIDLEGLVADAAVAGENDRRDEERLARGAVPVVRVPRVPVSAVDGPLTTALTGAHHVRLGHEAYVPTEEPWGDANAPAASVWLAHTESALIVRVAMESGHGIVTPGGSVASMPDNPLDNERADVNADGLQCYVRGAADRAWRAAVLVVPVVGHAAPPAARVTSLVTNGAIPTCAAASRSDGRGWWMQLAWPLEALPDRETVHVDLVLNERPPDRARRRGQLVLSGGGGFGYLRGDRHPPSHGWVLHLA